MNSNPSFDLIIDKNPRKQHILSKDKTYQLFNDEFKFYNTKRMILHPPLIENVVPIWNVDKTDSGFWGNYKKILDQFFFAYKKPILGKISLVSILYDIFNFLIIFFNKSGFVSAK